MAKSPFETLGISATASDQEVKKAYRSLARRFHPDLNPDDKDASQQFSEIQEAYQSIIGGDGDFGDDQGEDLFASPFRSFTDDDLFAFSPRGGAWWDRGEDIKANARLTFDQALAGATIRVLLPDGLPVTVTVPPGSDDGDVLRVSGRGHPGTSSPGDLLVVLLVADSKIYLRDGLDLTVDFPLRFDQALLGAVVSVPTPLGKRKIKVPPQSVSGSLLRLRDHGVPIGPQRGDLFVRFYVDVPLDPSDELKEAVGNLDLPDPDLPV